MSKFGDELIEAIKEAAAFAKGDVNPKDYRVHIPKRTPLGEKSIEARGEALAHPRGEIALPTRIISDRQKGGKKTSDR